MPIPQLQSKYVKNKNWRANKKKYYVSRTRKGKSHGSYKSGGFGSGNNKFLKNFKKKIFIYGLLLLLAAVLSGIIAITWLSRGLPDPNRLIEREVAQTTKIYDRTGETVLYEIHGNEQRTIINLDDLPPYIKFATIAIEDKDFYKHKGISLWGIFRGVVWQKIRGNRAQGGSTLTQQFVKNAILTPKRSVKRKIKEWILAYKIEKKYSKDEILQMYFNEIPYGSTAYGVEAASQRYFGKSARDINIAEAAILAALPQAPSRYSPYGSNLEILIQRQNYIISLMLEQEYISEEEAAAAKEYELEFRKQAANIKAPHFVMFIKEILSEKYGEKMVEQGGLKIWTTLDLYKQEIAEEVIADLTPKNEKNYEASNAALVAIDPKTGQILSMVGSRDYFNDDIDGQVNITTSKRQPGSSLKPLVYAASFLKGYTPNTILYDVITNFSHDQSEPYEPHNYDDQEHGPVTMRKALAGSLNIPAVKAIYLAGINNVLDLAQDLGYSTLGDRDRFGLSLVLGGGEVKLIEHTSAYSAFAREGVMHPLQAILKIEDREGKIIEEYESQEKKVLDPKVARQVNDILSDNGARAYAFGESNWLTLGSRPVAAKTGTTNDYRDAWTIGYTPSLVAGVWVGNNDNSEMKRGAAGGTVAAPIWHDFMKKVLGDTPIEYFKEVEISKTGKPILDGEAGAKTIVKIDKSSGLLATEFTPPEYIEEKIFFEPHSLLYFVDKNDPLGDAPAKPERDPQFFLWEDRVLAWAEEQKGTSTAAFSTSTPPIEYDDKHTAANQPELKIISPINNQNIAGSMLTARIQAKAARGIKKAEYYINGHLFSINNNYPFNLEKNINFLPNGFHNLKVRVCDDVDNCAEDEIEFNLKLNGKNNNKEININITSPNSGLAVSNIDFPLSLEADIKNTAAAAQVNFYYLAENNNKPALIKSIQPVEDSAIKTFWDNIPVSGTYKIYGETVSWNNKTIKSKEVIIIINNIIKEKK